MVDKPRGPRGPNTRPAGKPAKGPARPRTVGGIDSRAYEVLEREGLLTEEGRKLRSGGDTARVKSAAPAPARAPGPKPALRAKAPARPLEAPRGRGRKQGAVEQEAAAERLHKVMAQAGVASRRHSEELIQAGRVTVNGKVVTELGTKVIPGKDLIEVDGRALGKPESQIYIVMNKPKGYVTTLYDPEGRRKVVDLLGEEISQRVYPVGRLDYETEGLLLLTNDGELANALMHPAKMVRKTYIAKVRGVPGPAKIKALESGIELEDGVTAPAEVKMLEVRPPNSATVSVRIHEGRNRQVRRMFEAIGHEVIHLKRTTLGPLHLKALEVGQWRELTPQEVKDLRTAAGLKTRGLPGEAGPAQTPPRPVSRRGGARFAPRGPVAAAVEEPAAAPPVRGGLRPKSGVRPAGTGLGMPTQRTASRPAPRLGATLGGPKKRPTK